MSTKTFLIIVAVGIIAYWLWKKNKTYTKEEVQNAIVGAGMFGTAQFGYGPK